MNRLAPLLETLDRLARGSGWAGLAGGVLLVFAAAFWMNGNRVQAHELAALTARAAELRAALARPPRDEGRSPRAQLAAFYGQLPPADGLPDVLLRFHALAEKHGVELARAEYREQKKSGEPVTRVTLEFPARAAYPQLRGWLAAVAEHLPGTALQELRLRRDAIDRNQVEARLRFVVMLGRRT